MVGAVADLLILEKEAQRETATPLETLRREVGELVI